MPRKNLTEVYCSSWDEWFLRMRDWLCRSNLVYDYSQSGLGWQVIDAEYAVDEYQLTYGDWFLIFSPGESGKEDLYYQIFFDSTFWITSHQYWDTATRTGYNSSRKLTLMSRYTARETLSGGLPFYVYLYIYGDLDHFYVWSRFNRDYSSFGYWLDQTGYDHFSGVLGPHIYDRTIAVSAASVPAGANRVVTVDVVPASWAVGGKVVIRDRYNVEWVTIGEIAGNDVTLTSVVATYGADCRLAQVYPRVVGIGTGGKHALFMDFRGSKQNNFSGTTTNNYGTVETHKSGYNFPPWPARGGTVIYPDGVTFHYITTLAVGMSSSTHGGGLWGVLPGVLLLDYRNAWNGFYTPDDINIYRHFVFSVGQSGTARFYFSLLLLEVD